MRHPSPPQKSRARCRRSAGVRGVGVSTQTRSARAPRGHGPPPAFGTGDRMRSDEDVGRRQVRFDGLDDLPLGAAGVGDKGPGRHGLGGPAHVVRNPADRGADHHDLGLGNACFQVGRGLVDDPSILRLRSVGFRSRPTPTTRAARPRERSASPIEPPISPTPTIATVSRRARRSLATESACSDHDPNLHGSFILSSSPSPKRDRTSDLGSQSGVGPRHQSQSWLGVGERAEGSAMARPTSSGSAAASSEL